MRQHLGLVSLVVRDYDEALAFHRAVPVFLDLCGKPWALVQPTDRSRD